MVSYCSYCNMKITFYCIIMEKYIYNQLNNYVLNFNILDHKHSVRKFHSTIQLQFLSLVIFYGLDYKNNI